MPTAATRHTRARSAFTAALLAAASLASAPLASAPLAAQQPLQGADLATRIEHARSLFTGSPLVDGHNDLPWAMREFAASPLDVDAYDLTKRTTGHTDLPRLRQGGVGGQFWSVYIPGEVADSGYARMQLEQIDIARRMIARYPRDLMPALTVADLRVAHKTGRIGSMLGMEGGHVLENSLGALRAYYELGARYLTLTHNVTLDWADAASDVPKHGGLTEFGREVVREMNRLGMLVDLSHTSPGTMSDALDVTEAPVIFSHSNARALTDVPRNVPDSILRRLPANGGVVMVTFVPGFLRQGGSTRVTVSDVADHIDHIRKIAGHGHVGIGGDFDGITETVEGLEDVSTYPVLFAELIKRGWTDHELRDLAGGNVLRALSDAENTARHLHGERPASTKTIQQLDGAPRE